MNEEICRFKLSNLEVFAIKKWKNFQKKNLFQINKIKLK